MLKKNEKVRDNRFILGFPSMAQNSEEHLDQIPRVGKASVTRESVNVRAGAKGIHNSYFFKMYFVAADTFCCICIL